MLKRKKILGIDIGSISVSIVEMTREKEITRTAYSFHRGKVSETLAALLSDFDLSSIAGVAATSSSPEILRNAAVYDTRISYITAARHLHEKIGSILIVGGEKFGLVLFDEAGEYLNYRSNTSCAAGTGSFLDQQAARLSLPGIQDFSEVAYGNTGKIPKIASRCAVFAKTDLIHAQQEGYSLAEICDGLSYGLVKNIADTLFSNITPGNPMVFCGGVSKNRAVVKHFNRVLGIDVITHEHSHLYGAIGAAMNRIEDRAAPAAGEISRPEDVILVREKQKNYYYDSLELRLSEYPEFDSVERYEYVPRAGEFTVPVEVDIYQRLAGGECPAYLGIDIGSTSTKAAVIGAEGGVIAGLYTRTSGRPVMAVQAIFECLDDIMARNRVAFRFLGTGTTGSGRKFIGEIIGADIALDEITAHARAAYELDPEVDTVIEIGGQDAKFTTLRNGMVTFSVMNHVCAAGTGSFIEEQAKKLGCPLTEYSDRARGKRAPLSSDRCTVFMERDLNYYLSEGFTVNEGLASVLHSVRDNYLTKVAVEKNIGNRVFFQGATAKNRALIAAFEQRLQKPIMVSKYCHLTGGLGVALHLRDQGANESSFRGIGLYRHAIPFRTEVCDICTNHCKITVAQVDGTEVAFGFLCGRDYNTEQYVKKPKGFDLLKERNRVLYAREPGSEPPEYASGLTVGIPSALHLVDEIPLWKKFFDLLGVRTVTSEQYREAISEGKNIAGAEFCAPISALHGHVNFLAERADYVFLPNYMENKHPDRETRRNYCYYTQYSPSMVLSAVGVRNKERILSPLIRSNLGTFYMKVQLYRMMRKITGEMLGFMQISSAYDQAQEHYDNAREELKKVFTRETEGRDDISVVFVGRPYTILSRSMNNGIPDIFAKHGIKTFFQDMLTYSGAEVEEISALLGAVHWKYASHILEAAQVIAGREGAYPVFVTSFKCTPDSYVIEYFKKILDIRKKPYLILQLDEHDSSVGYETRVEAGIRAFRNHFRSGERGAATTPALDAHGFTRNREDLAGKTFLLPNWDWISCGLIEATLRKEGIDARVVSDSPDSIQRSMRFNSGQCIPLNIIIQNYIDFIERNGLDPDRTVVWSPKSQIACNIGMFPYYTKSMLESYGKGLERIPVFMGDVTFVDLSIRIGVNCYLAYLFGGMLRKVGCSLRPYENNHGETDRALRAAFDILYDAFLNDRSKEEALEKAIRLFEAIEFTRTERPTVAIFGDLYARDNDVLNQDLIRTIEENGGEVITTPYSELIDIVADRYIKKWFMQGLYKDAAVAKVLSKVVLMLNGKYNKYFERILPARKAPVVDSAEKYVKDFDLSVYHTGESMENMMKIFHLVEQHPDLSLFVQTNPAYCCPSLVTEAMADRIEQITGIPIITIEYDGTGGSKNDDVIPYLKYPRRKKGKEYKKAI